MVKKNDYQQRNTNQGNFQNHGPRVVVHHDHSVNRGAEHGTERSPERNMNHVPERSGAERSMNRSNEQNVERSDAERRPDRNMERNVDRSIGRSPRRIVEHNASPNSMDRGIERSVGRGPERSTDRSTYRDNRQFRSYSREASTRHSYSGQSSDAKYNIRAKADESVEDIKADITRIEKEIELEIREIKSMRLGL